MKKIIVLLALAAGCGGEPNEYSVRATNTFMNECSQGQPITYCRCVLRKMQSAWTEERFWEVDSQIRAGGVVPNELYDFMEGCE